jgi:hypothetical protein
MSYGIEFRNSNDVVTLDSEFSRLVVLQRGRYSGGATFSPPITTDEPPLVFVRPDASSTFQYATISGTPGNWTGFTFIGNVPGNFFVAAFQSREVSGYGFRIWDGQSKLLFDSGTPCAQFTRTITQWTYLGSSNTSQGQTKSSWTAYSPIDTGDYMLINNIGMDVCGSSSAYAKLYCTWEYENNRIVPFVVGVSNSVHFYIPISFAKPMS